MALMKMSVEMNLMMRTLLLINKNRNLADLPLGPINPLTIAWQKFNINIFTLFKQIIASQGKCKPFVKLAALVIDHTVHVLTGSCFAYIVSRCLTFALPLRT